MNSKKAELLMLSVSLAWGSSYLLMKLGLDGIGPFALIALRFGVAFLCMAVLFLPRFRALTPALLAKGALMGALLFCLFTGLVFGVKYTTASTAGFLASTTVVIVPVLESILRRRLPAKATVLSVALTIAGLCLLTMKGGFSLDLGAACCLLAALFYAVYIVVLDRISQTTDTFLISILQLGTASLLGAVCMLCFETPALPQTPVQWGALLGLGIVCSAYGFVVQPMAQRSLSPEKIGLIFSLEPVFSAILSFLFLHEVLDAKGCLGAVLIFTGVLSSKLARPAAAFFRRMRSPTAASGRLHSFRRRT